MATYTFYLHANNSTLNNTKNKNLKDCSVSLCKNAKCKNDINAVSLPAPQPPTEASLR